MGRMRCTCGNIMSDSEVPNRVRMWVHPDDEWQQVILSLKEGMWNWKRRWSIWYCPVCKRIYALENAKNVTTVFVLQNEVLQECSCFDKKQ